MSEKRTGSGARSRREMRRRQRRLKCFLVLLFLVFIGLCAVKLHTDMERTAALYGNVSQMSGHGGEEEAVGMPGEGRDIEKELEEMLERNPETKEFVMGYADRAEYLGQEIDLSEEYVPGEVPLLMQWDKRWGYEKLGDTIIGLGGCGPACLSMAYLYFTGDTDGNPRKMALFCEENGFYTEAGAEWSLWTLGAAELGLSGRELPLGGSVMQNVLDKGELIICSMRPGDFTTTGHYILLWGYDENGFFIHDPNRQANSDRQWTYEELSRQIKNLWALSGGEN